ncbi:hypothetical protein LEM8419_01841 [Neolewinella maritima]|uniref:UspA domain-containing protein n=1 Tax=Neolewinella maritima TaxID=1383882 RepID=A0ABM9B195_9BACT|nr:universal stress protein [Neolewinella maritima]CAH1000707.1 hypothetical protein LEM8419_01841 [Neolewinella maritima]
MQRIIVPVDFSDTSAAAVRFGTYLAETMNLDLNIVHVFDTMLSTSQTISNRVRELEKERIGKQLTDFARRNVEPVLSTFQGRLDLLPNVKTAALEGAAAQTILWESTKEDVALIVMGGVGAGAGLHPPGIFGGVARTLALRSGCPLILIPKEYGYPQVERLAIAFDGVDDIRRMAAFSRRVIKALHPEVHFVHVREQDHLTEARRDDEFLDLACGANFPSYTYKFDALPHGKVTEELLAYTERERINLLVLGGERRSFFERLFEAGHLAPLVKRCTVPMLIIPFDR